MKNWLLALLFLAASFMPQQVEATSPLPIRVAVVIPANYSMYVETDFVLEMVDGLMQRSRSWIERETGYTFDYTIQIIKARQTREYLASDPISHTSIVDTCSQEGVSIYRIYEEIILGQMGLDGNKPHRVWLLAFGGGALAWGWLGGMYKDTPLGSQIGYTIVSDRYVKLATTGKQDPCDPYEVYDPLWVWGHEILHSFGVDSHNPPLFGGDSLPNEHREVLINANRLFLKPVSKQAETTKSPRLTFYIMLENMRNYF